MILDFAKFDDRAAVAADICIVGGSAAGITTAREFIGTRFTLLILEASEPEGVNPGQDVGPCMLMFRSDNQELTRKIASDVEARCDPQGA